MVLAAAVVTAAVAPSVAISHPPSVHAHPASQSFSPASGFAPPGMSESNGASPWLLIPIGVAAGLAVLLLFLRSARQDSN